MNAPHSGSKLAVVKVGTDGLKGHDGLLNEQLMHSLMRQCVILRQKYDEVFLVSSGAVLAGAIARGTTSPSSAPTGHRQALASVGQRHLLNLYGAALQDLQWDLAQIMVDPDAFTRHSGLDGTLRSLRGHRIIPIFNWNDPLHTEEVEIPFGNNDNLALQLALKFHADVLVLLTNIDGVMEDFGTPSAQRIAHVSIQTVDRCRSCICESKSTHGTGGMRPKFDAAVTFMNSTNRYAYIADARTVNVLPRLLIDSEPLGTSFRSDSPRVHPHLL